MLVLITYDVNTQTAAGRKRLRKVAKECTNYGQRVQNSVFECQMDATKCRQVKNILENIIDKEVDSLRVYYLGEKYKNKVEHIGAKPGFDAYKLIRQLNEEYVDILVRMISAHKFPRTFAPKKGEN